MVPAAVRQRCLTESGLQKTHRTEKGSAWSMSLHSSVFVDPVRREVTKGMTDRHSLRPSRRRKVKTGLSCWTVIPVASFLSRVCWLLRDTVPSPPTRRRVSQNICFGHGLRAAFCLCVHHFSVVRCLRPTCMLLLTVFIWTSWSFGKQLSARLLSRGCRDKLVPDRP